MALFTTARERRLWLWALAAVVAIYSTLGLARTLAAELRNRDLLDATFVFGALLIVAWVVAFGLRMRVGTAEIAVALGVGAVYLLVFVRMGIPEERTHLVEYGVVAVLIHEALKERTAGRRGATVPVIGLMIFANDHDETPRPGLPGARRSRSRPREAGSRLLSATP